jgi:ABC-type sugar transport system permease subunit
MVVASVQAINIEFYEAADIDGASRWFKFAKITLPLISPSLIVATLLIAIWVANNIPITLLLTYGGPIHSSEIWATWIYKRAFVFFDFGMGATASAMNFILLLAFSIAYVYLFRGVLTGRG